MGTSTYVLPALILNPVFILHSLNTLFSWRFPPTPNGPDTTIASPHAYLEKLGPLPGSQPYFSVREPTFCWAYTLIMVIMQVIAYAQVGGNRIKKKNKLRRRGVDIKHSRWSEPDDSNPIVDESGKKEMGVEAEVWRAGLDGAGDGPAKEKFQSASRRRQVRSLRSGKMDLPDQREGDRQNGRMRSGVGRMGNDREDMEDEESDDSSVETETSEEVMIL